jgi:hypothetical protein
MTWGTMHPDLSICGAHCEVAPIGAEAHSADVEVAGRSGIVI